MTDEKAMLIAPLEPHPGLVDGPIYLDYNATTPLDPRVLRAAMPFLVTHFGNPSSAHAYARAPKQAVDRARDQVGQLLGARPEEIVFTGGGSESDTLAIRGAALANRDRGGHIITQPTEHPAVLAACESLRADGFRLTYLPVDGHGRVEPANLRAVISSDTALVSVMVGNAETGTLQPVAELAAIARAHAALFHTDAAQAAGKIVLDVDELGVDLLTVVGHKIYAPKGVGALYVRAGTRLQPIIHGGGQEYGLRAGTENVAFIVALGAAAQIARAELPESTTQLHAVRERLHQQLEELLPGRVRLNGHPTDRLPGTLNVSIAGIMGRELLAAVPAIAAATGSACHEGLEQPSPVLTAMGIDAERSAAALRLTLGRWSNDAEIDRAARLIAAHVRTTTAALRR
jgi:cysteine desulfurase